MQDIIKKSINNQVVLLVLDGWGLSPSWGGNAISMNNPQNMNELWRNYPKTVLKAFEVIAGKHGKVGNSEIGHASIGCGKMVDQDIVEIDKAIENGSFFTNPNLIEVAQYVKDYKSTLHLIGLLSDGAVHSHTDHLFALLKFARDNKIPKTVIHVITDGRDVDKMSALTYITSLEKKITQLGFNSPVSKQVALIGTLVGRYYGLDRNQNLDRTSIAYELQVFGRGIHAKNAREAITKNYQQGLIDDEMLPPCVIENSDGSINNIKDSDGVIFFNFRSDRARQLTRFYTDKKYLRSWLFFRKYPLLKIMFATLTSYHLPEDLPIKIIYNPGKIETSLAKILSSHGFNQLHIAESEKYAHVTYFFNGGYEQTFDGEKRIIIPSLKVDNYAKYPEMSADKITKEVIKGMKDKTNRFILANYANVDMVGHTGDINAASKAIKTVDDEVKKVVEAGLKNGLTIIITADHGNAEQMINIGANDKETRHTLSPVPFILINANNKKDLVKSALTPTKGISEKIVGTSNTLADVAPTILQLFNISKPQDMTGKSLLDELE